MYARNNIRDLVEPKLPVMCHCDGKGGKGMCIIESRSGSDDDVAFSGFLRDDPSIKGTWKAGDLTICERDPKKNAALKEAVKAFHCIENVKVPQAGKPLYPYAVSSVEINMATHGIYDAIGKCFPGEESKDASDAVYLGSSCTAHVDNHEPMAKKRGCMSMASMVPPFGILKKTDESTEKWHDKNELFIFKKLFDIGTTLGSAEAATPYTNWSGD